MCRRGPQKVSDILRDRRGKVSQTPSASFVKKTPKLSKKTGLVMDRRWEGGPSFFHVVGRGPARPIKFLEGGLGPSIFQRPGRGPARPGPSIFSEDGLRPGPAHRISNYIGPAYQHFNFSALPGPTHDIRSEAHETRARPVDLKSRPMGRPRVAHVFPRTKKCTLTFFLYFVLIIIGYIITRCYISLHTDS